MATGVGAFEHHLVRSSVDRLGLANRPGRAIDRSRKLRARGRHFDAQATYFAFEGRDLFVRLRLPIVALWDCGRLLPGLARARDPAARLLANGLLLQRAKPVRDLVGLLEA